MTSFILSSDSAKPPWPQVWVAAIVTVLVIVGSWEWLARDAGLGPEYADNRSLWVDARHRLNAAGDDAIALLGASRLQYAVDVSTMSDGMGRPVVQLAVEGTSALATLENLAAEGFSGTVIYSVAPAFTFNSILPRIFNGKQLEWVEFYQQQSSSRRMEQSMRLWLQGRLAFRSPDASLTRVASSLLDSGALPDNDEKTVFGDRVLHVDYSKAPVEEIQMVQFYLENTVPYSDPEFGVILNYIDGLVTQLRRNGANVIFLRLPSSEEVNLLESAFFPKSRYWDRMAQQLDAVFIHADDFPQMAAYVGGDGSHIDTSNIVEFTRELAEILRQQAR